MYFTRSNASGRMMILHGPLLLYELHLCWFHRGVR